MKKLIYLLLAMPLLFTSCSNDEEMASEETVQVSFSTELPKRISTRANATNLNVNKVVCAVFEGGKEIRILREVITIQEGEGIVFAPRLIKGRKYDVVFWAYKEGSYDVDNLTEITRITDKPEADYDAFTHSEEITVSSSDSKTITLTRPLAQLNIGVTIDDWDTVKNKFSMTPKTMAITLSDKKTFNALTGTAVGSDELITYNLNCSGNDFTVNNTTYKSIASCYVLTDANKENFDISYTIYTIKDQNPSPIRSDVTISSIPLHANYKTNVVGGLLTGVITYNISINQAFDEDEEHNKTIE